MFSVLHVEHSQFFRRVVKDIIRDEGLQFFSAETPSDAYVLLNNLKVDLIITGLEFKHENGENFIRGLKHSRFENIPVIVLSGKTEEQVKAKLNDYGVVDLLSKDSFAGSLKGHIDEIKANQ